MSKIILLFAAAFAILYFASCAEAGYKPVYELLLRKKLGFEVTQISDSPYLSQYNQ